MLIDGFKSSVEAEYIHAFEEEKAMFDCVKDFPENGSIELATEKLLDGIEKNRFTDKELEFLMTQFKDFFHIKEGFENNPDLLLDMQHSGQLVPMPKTYYTDVDMVDMDEYKEYSKTILKDLMNGAAATKLGVYRGDDTQLFYHRLLGNELYNSDTAQALHDAKDDFDLATEKFLEIVTDQKKDVKERILEDFRQEIEEGFYNDEGVHQTLLENKENKIKENFAKAGFLKEEETYLILDFKNKKICDWNLINVKNLDDIKKAMMPKRTTQISNITYKENTPYFEAKIYDPPNHKVFLLPESQWDRVEGYNKETGAYGQGYSFLEEAKKIDEVKEIFLSRRMLREMEKEAEKNPIIKEMKEIYELNLDGYNSTAENFQYRNSDEELLGKDFHYELFDSPTNKRTNSNIEAWKQVSGELAYKVVKSSNVKENYKKAEALLIKFNPTLQTSYEVVKYFKQQCENMMKYYKSAGKSNQNHR